MRYGIDAIVDAAHVLNLLRFEGHENGGTFRGQGTGGVNALEAEGQHRVQRDLLLVAQNVELTAPRPPDGLQGLGVLIELLQIVRQMGQRDKRQHHALVAAHEIIHEFLCFAPCQFQFIGDIGVIVAILVLPLPTAGNV